MTAPYTDPSLVQKEERYATGGTPEHAGLKVFFYTQMFRLPSGYVESRVVHIEVAASSAGDFNFPLPEPMVHHDVSDWHGPATLPLLASMPIEEQTRRVAQVRSHHGPHSTLPCCIRRKALGGSFVMPAPITPTPIKEAA